MRVIITGTPGTGKTTVASFLSKTEGFKMLNIKSILKSSSEDYDNDMHCFIVDERKFSKAVENKLRECDEDYIIDSHLSHYLNPEYVDLCIVTVCNPDILRKRLKKRGYTASKIAENLDAEIFRVCEVEAKEMGHDVVVVDTSSDWKSSLGKMIKTRCSKLSTS